MRKIIIFFFINLLYLNSYSAVLELPSIFKNDMVIQQQDDVLFWGKGNPEMPVNIKVSWDKKKYSTIVNSDSTWKIRVRTTLASYNEHTVSISSGKEKKIINNVLIGEVWLCSGQSNMEMRMKGFVNQPVEGSLYDILHSRNNNIRCFTLERQSSIEPKFDCPGSWTIASPNTTAEFTATGYYFGRLLHSTLDIPIGLIHSSWGGSTIEAWMSSNAMKSFPDMPTPKFENENKIRWKTPTVLFNGMLNSVVGYGIKGIIWYQGESNRYNHKIYASQFKEMHEDWMKKWGKGIFPIYFCQLAPYSYGDEEKYNNAFMREVQLKISQNQPHTAMAVLMDVGDSLLIHPTHKKEAGERLAMIALAKDYGFEQLPYKSPEYKSHEIKENKITLRFNYAPDGLSSFGKVLSGFEIAGDDKVFYPADAKLVRVGVEVSSPLVLQPKAVRYAFKDFFSATLFGVNKLPVSSFRTDDWDEIK